VLFAIKREVSGELPWMDWAAGVFIPSREHFESVPASPCFTFCKYAFPECARDAQYK
jgi:hypothetical protein